METVGVRDLKANLSRHLKRVRAGARLLVADRGRVVAIIDPFEAPDGARWARELVAAGAARWDGGKPSGCRARVPEISGASVSAAVLEDRQ